MLLLSLGSDTLIRLMACGDRPGFHGPDLSWLLYGPDTDGTRAQAGVRGEAQTFSQQKQPLS